MSSDNDKIGLPKTSSAYDAWKKSRQQSQPPNYSAQNPHNINNNLGNVHGPLPSQQNNNTSGGCLNSINGCANTTLIVVFCVIVIGYLMFSFF